MAQYIDDVGAFIRNLIRGGGDDPLFDADFMAGCPRINSDYSPKIILAGSWLMA